MATIRKIEINNKNAEGLWEILYPKTTADQVITDAENRFVSDVKIAEWDAKAPNVLATSTTNGLLSSADKVVLEGLTGALAAAEQNAKDHAQTLVDGIIDGAPDAYNTLKEISDYIAAHGSEYDALLALTQGKASTEQLNTAVADLTAIIETKASAADVKPTVISPDEPADLPVGGMWYKEIVVTP